MEDVATRRYSKVKDDDDEEQREDKMLNEDA